MSVTVFAGLVLAANLLFGALWLRSRRAAWALFSAALLAAYWVLPSFPFAVVATLLLTVLLSAPLFLTLGALCVVCFFFGTDEYQHFSDYQLLIEKIFTLTDKNVLLAIPFFVTAGAIMTAGSIARKIIAFADALVGWLPGGLAATAVFSCAFFAAISGSSPATVIAIGSVLVPALVERKYGEGFSLGLVTAAGSLGILIPPSIPMILYAIVVTGPMGVNVADLFLAGLLPGALIALVLIAYCVLSGLLSEGFRRGERRVPNLSEIARTFREGFWALLLPVVILGGIYPLFGSRGLFTPTEAAAVSVVYALVVEVGVHRELRWSKLPRLCIDSTVMMGALLVIMTLAFSLNHFLVDQEIPDAAVAWMQTLDVGRVGFLVSLNLLLLLVGCLMDIVSAILVVAPLVAPIAASFGIHPLHLAIVFVVNLEIGYLTPPIGMNLFVSSALFQRPIAFVTRAVLPFAGLLLISLASITWFESISLAIAGGDASASPSSDALAPPNPEASRVKPSESDSAGSARHPPSSEEARGVLSIEELMKQADAPAGETGKARGPDATAKPAAGRVLSIEELMRQARETERLGERDGGRNNSLP